MPAAQCFQLAQPTILFLERQVTCMQPTIHAWTHTRRPLNRHSMSLIRSPLPGWPPWHTALDIALGGIAGGTHTPLTPPCFPVMCRHAMSDIQVEYVLLSASLPYKQVPPKTS